MVKKMKILVLCGFMSSLVFATEEFESGNADSLLPLAEVSLPTRAPDSARQKIERHARETAVITAAGFGAYHLMHMAEYQLYSCVVMPSTAETLTNISPLPYLAGAVGIYVGKETAPTVVKTLKKIEPFMQPVANLYHRTVGWGLIKLGEFMQRKAKKD